MTTHRFAGKFNMSTMKNELLLPKEFGDEGTELGHMCTVRRSNTYALWDCHVKRVRHGSSDTGTHAKISVGWSKVVEDNDVADGDTLYFEYHGNSVFTLFVVGPNKVSKEMEHLIGDPSGGKYKQVREMKVLIMLAENSFAATLYMTRSTKEAFMVPITEDIVADGFVEIPSSFVKKYLIYEGVNTTVPLVLEVQGQQSTIALKYIRKGKDIVSCIINSTFRDFILRHTCNGHGVFVFELESPFDPVVMKVTIFQM